MKNHASYFVRRAVWATGLVAFCFNSVCQAVTQPTVDPLAYEATPSPKSVLLTFADGPDTRGFAWQTDTSVSETKLWLVEGAHTAADAALFDAATPISGTYVDRTQGTSPAKTVRRHKAQASGLAAGKTYSYRIGGAGNYAYGTFAVTAEPSARTILYFGDAQTKYTPTFFAWENTVQRAAEVQPSADLILFGGDMFDTYTTSISPYNYLKWGATVDSATPYYPGVAWSLACGNHDLIKSGSTYYEDCTAVNYQPPGCHSYDSGAAHIAVLPFLNGEPAANYTGVAEWLDADLKAANAAGRTKWNVVMMHWGPYTTGDHGISANVEGIVELFCPIFSANHVDLVLQAHDHTYSKTLPYRWDTVGYTTSRTDGTIVNTSPETTTIGGETYDLNPKGTYYVGTGCSGPRVYEGNGEYAYIGAKNSYDSKRKYKIATGKIAVTSAYGTAGDDGSSELHESMFGVLRVDESTLTYDWYAVATNGLSAAVLYDTLRIAKSANSFRVTPYVQRPAKDAVTLMWLAQTNGSASVSWWVQGGAETNTIPTATEIPPTDRVANSRFTADGVLQYCLAPELGYDQSCEPGDNYPSYTREGKSAGWSMPYTVPYQYRVRLTGLKPGTTYGYRVTLAGGASYEKVFRTSPDGWKDIRFIYYSDSETEPADNPPSTGRTTDWTDPKTGQGRTYYATQTEAYASNLAAVVSFKPDLIVMAGDLAQKGSRQGDWDEFWRHNAGPLNDPAGSIPIVASPGNHDYWSYLDGGESGMKKYMSYFEYEPNGAAVDDDVQERFHRVDYGPATFLFMDANNGDDSDYTKDTNRYLARENSDYSLYTAPQGRGCRAPDFNPGSAQYAWLEEQLKDAQKKSAFIFVVSHQCPYSVGDHGQPNAPDGTSGEPLSGRALRVLEPLFHKYGVTAWLAGHDEMMERSSVVGTETCVDGTERPHTLQIWDMGIAGDGLRGGKKIDNPQEQFRADKDSAEVYGADGYLTDGGKHYGHLEVSITEREDGAWVATFDPVYEFFTTNEKGEAVYGGTRHYADKVVIVNESTIRRDTGYTVNDYIKDGLIAHWDGEFNQGTDKPHDSSATTWVDLSGCGHLATATVVSGKTPVWGDNCLHTANDTVKNSYYAFTPNADFLAAINAGTFSYQACFKMNTFITDCGPFGCKGGGVWGMREDGSGNTYFGVKGKEVGLGNHKTQWLAGCVDSIGSDGLCYSGVLNTSLDSNNSALSPGATLTTGSGRIGGQCANYTGNVDADIYAGRVYSRGLTGVELAYNAEIDRVRYFGDTPRTTKWVSAYTEPSNYRYGSPTPAYGTLKAVETGATQTFSVPALTTHAFDGKRVFSVSDVTRAIYLGATLTAIAGNGTETRTDYPATVESIPDVTVDRDMFVTWKFNRQYRFKAVAMKGGTLRIGTSEAPLSAYTNWYDAAASAQVTVTAVPDEGYAFSSWGGDITMPASEITQTVTLNQGRTLEVSFVRSGKGDGSTYCWKGGAATTSWNDPDNWEGGMGPLEDDHVVITSKTAQTVLLDAATPRYKSVTIGGGDSAAITLNLQNWATAVNAETVTIGANATVRPSAAFADNENSNRVWFVCDSFTLAAGARIDASQRGWIHRKNTQPGSGPGGGQGDRGGAGYGGIGTGGNSIWGGSTGRAYGSIEAPEDPGSSGGCDGAYANAGAGGGAVRLQVAGHAQIDGDIRADGGAAASNVGGGSGGGVYITCGTFDGTGRITAIGGAVYSTAAGGGAGGRIAIVWSDAEGQKAYSPTPIMCAGSRAYGSSSGCYPPNNRQLYNQELYYYVGGRGTVYLTDDSFHPGTIWSKCAGEFHYGTRTHDSLTIGREPFVAENAVDATKLAQDVYLTDLTVDIPDGLVLPKYAHLTLSNCTVTAKSLAVTNGCFELLGNSTLTVAEDMIAAGTGRLNFESGVTNGVGAEAWSDCGQKVSVAGRVLLADTAVLYPASERINGGSVAFELGSLVVESGAKIDGATRGWGKWAANSVSKNGAGPGGSSTYAGAAYGGKGGGVYVNGKTYGDEKHPSLPGSEGWYNSTSGYVGGYGGGLFYATVADLVQIDGTVRMTGGNSSATQGSAGSGGAVYLRCNRLAGAGVISADGGKGGNGTSYSGCGGGGRVAIYCNQTNNWTGTVTANAGSNSYTYKYAAEDGTVFWKVLKGLMLLVR